MSKLFLDITISFEIFTWDFHLKTFLTYLPLIVAVLFDSKLIFDGNPAGLKVCVVGTLPSDIKK